MPPYYLDKIHDDHHYKYTFTCTCQPRTVCSSRFAQRLIAAQYIWLATAFLACSGALFLLICCSFASNRSKAVYNLRVLALCLFGITFFGGWTFLGLGFAHPQGNPYSIWCRYTPLNRTEMTTDLMDICSISSNNVCRPRARASVTARRNNARTSTARTRARASAASWLASSLALPSSAATLPVRSRRLSPPQRVAGALRGRQPSSHTPSRAFAQTDGLVENGTHRDLALTDMALGASAPGAEPDVLYPPQQPVPYPPPQQPPYSHDDPAAVLYAPQRDADVLYPPLRDGSKADEAGAADSAQDEPPPPYEEASKRQTDA